MDGLTPKQKARERMVDEAWKEIEIILNANINDLCNQNRHSDARDLENCRDIIKIALQMAGYKLRTSKAQ